MNTNIMIQNGDILSALRGFLKTLFANEILDALFVPLETNKGVILPALVTDPARLERANPLAPVMPINGARAVSALTGKRPLERLGVVLRSCEMRALVELIKLQQASLEGVLVIGIDCPGTFELSEYYRRRGNGDFDLSAYLAAAREGYDREVNEIPIRHACKMCVQPVTEPAAIRIHLFGADLCGAIPIELDDGLAERLKMPVVDGIDGDKRRAVIEKVVAAHRQVREKELASIRARMNSDGGMLGLFETCIRCHNCMTACPICYCKTCLFRTAAFDHHPEHYLSTARRKGAARMLGDTLLFQMTRMNHMSASCVSCGMCTSACPADIQVGAIFSAVGEQVQTAFGYAPGRDIHEPLPLVAFQANEWTEVGEAR